jgi:hypothetical protein
VLLQFRTFTLPTNRRVPYAVAMASTPLAQLLTEVASINDPKQPYSYAVDGQTIVGTWNIVNARYLDLVGAKVGKIDKSYSITVKFDEKKNKFDFVETKVDSSGGVGIAPDGDVSIGAEKSFFKGKSSSKEFSFTFGDVNKTKAGISPILSYKFETKMIKDPLFDFLKKIGWKPKSGLFNH